MSDSGVVLERLADQLAAMFTDPTLPAHQLKRPVYRVCLGCGGRYRSLVNILHDAGFCREACRRRWNEADGVERGDGWWI
jgi:hypothetical protein